MPAFAFLGPEGVGRLDAALALPTQEYYSDSRYATAAMFVALVNNHPFQDGNKRFAVVATNVFLMLNGLVGLLSSDEWEHLALGVARSELDAAAVTSYFDGRLFDVVGTPSPPDEGWLPFLAREGRVSAEIVRDLGRIIAGLADRANSLEGGDES